MFRQLGDVEEGHFHAFFSTIFYFAMCCMLVKIGFAVDYLYHDISLSKVKHMSFLILLSPKGDDEHVHYLSFFES